MIQLMARICTRDFQVSIPALKTIQYNHTSSCNVLFKGNIFILHVDEGAKEIPLSWNIGLNSVIV